LLSHELYTKPIETTKMANTQIVITSLALRREREIGRIGIAHIIKEKRIHINCNKNKGREEKNILDNALNKKEERV
jgi:hypothetical protein